MVVLGILPVLVLAALSQDGYGARAVLVMSSLIAYVFVLTAGGLVYWRWRAGSTHSVEARAQRQLSGWLTLGLLVTGMQGLVMTAPLIDGTGPADRWMLLDQIVLLSVLCAVGALADRVSVPGDPGLAGLLVGLVLSGGYVLGVALDDPVVPAGLVPAFGTITLLLALLLAWLVLARTPVDQWVRRRLAVSAVTLTASGAVLGTGSTHVLLVLVAAGADLVGALVLCVTMQRLLRGVLAEQRDEVSALQAALEEFNVGLVHHRELLHELSSTIAGIANASQVNRRSEVSAERRERLEAMVDAELARLQRLVSRSEQRSVDDPLDVDAVVGTIALSHQARGRLVLWEPTGLLASGSADDLAEVVNVLLENAARHAPGARVTLSSCRSADGVELRCRDDGPGIAPELAGRVFEAEARSATTGGQGLGLAIARRLMSEQHGRIDLEETGPSGTTFVVRLPLIGVSRELDVIA